MFFNPIATAKSQLGTTALLTMVAVCLYVLTIAPPSPPRGAEKAWLDHLWATGRPPVIVCDDLSRSSSCLTAKPREDAVYGFRIYEPAPSSCVSRTRSVEENPLTITAF